MKPEIKTSTWLNGQKMHETPYVNGQRHGLEIWWHLNGQKRHETPYVNGQIHGLATWWYFDGSLRYVEKWHQSQIVWRIHFPSKGEIPENAEMELCFP